MTLEAVETVNPGDEILVHPSVGYQMVAAVHAYGDEIVVCYFHAFESVFENRARQKGGFRKTRLVEKAIGVKRPGDLVDVERGQETRAEGMRRRMEREQDARFEAAEDRDRDRREAS